MPFSGNERNIIQELGDTKDTGRNALKSISLIVKGDRPAACACGWDKAEAGKISAAKNECETQNPA
jgi:hypothetical protein